MLVGIAADHGGFGLKEELITRLKTAGHEVVDSGARTLSDLDDYPNFVVPLARAVVAGQVDRGIAICGSGVGASALHGRRIVGPLVAWDLVETFMHAKFRQEPRHLRRLGKVAAVEAKSHEC